MHIHLAMDMRHNKLISILLKSSQLVDAKVDKEITPLHEGKSDIFSAEDKNNTKDDSTTIANNSNHPYDLPQTQNEAEEVKNQTKVTQLVEEDKNNQVNENECILNNLRDFVRRGKFEEIKSIVDKVPIEKFKEVVKAHTNSDWNLFHYVARRGDLKILDLLYSKLKDNSEQDLIFNLLKEKDEFSKTPYNVAQNNNKDELREKLLQLLNEMEADSTVKEEILNEAIMNQPNHYKPSERLVEGLEKRLRKEIENNTDHIPYFDDLKHAIEWDCNNLAKEIINGLQDKDQEERKYFIGKHGDYGWNILHFVADRGNIELLNLLCEFDINTMKKLSSEKNENDEIPYKIALNERYNNFCDSIKTLGLSYDDSLQSEVF